MMGKEGYAKMRPNSDCNSDETKSEDSQDSHGSANASNLLDSGDYNITNLAISRDLALIVGIAVLSEERKNRRPNSKRSPEATGNSYLFSYNLKGALIKCVELTGSKNREGTLLQTSSDGEYIILSECGSNIKILRSFDLSTLYALNTEPVGIKIRSFALVEMKYLLVGLDNGKFLLYNVDFNRWNHEYNNRYITL